MQTECSHSRQNRGKANADFTAHFTGIRYESYKKKFGRKEDEKSQNSPLYRYEACTVSTSRLKHHCKTQDAACIRIDVQIRIYAVIILGYLLDLGNRFCLYFPLLSRCSCVSPFLIPGPLMSGHDHHIPVSRDYANMAHLNATSQSQTLPRKSVDGDDLNDGSSPPRNRLTRVVGKSVDNITKSFSGRSTPQQQQTAGSPGHRRLFSLSRKGKGKDMSHAGGHSDSESYIFLGFCSYVDICSCECFR
jgi:hypothetical protein